MYGLFWWNHVMALCNKQVTTPQRFVFALLNLLWQKFILAVYTSLLFLNQNHCFKQSNPPTTHTHGMRDRSFEATGIHMNVRSQGFHRTILHFSEMTNATYFSCQWFWCSGWSMCLHSLINCENSLDKSTLYVLSVHFRIPNLYFCCKSTVNIYGL